MSILQTPRIHFKGHISWDPIVTNNKSAYYDESSGLIAPPDETMQHFRQRAIEAVKSAGNWNPHGTHQAKFFDTCVSAVDLGHGPVTADALCGAPANFSAMLVDLEPYGTYSSQLFFDGISFGIEGGCRVAARRGERFTARYINFSRNPVGFIAGGASVNWQTAFPLPGVQIDTHKSAALAALRQALEEDDAQGIVISFNAYRTVYYDDPTLVNGKPGPAGIQASELYNKLLAGGFQPNPARSLLVGTIGVWRKDEPVHEPGGRALLSVATSPTPIGSAHGRLDRHKLTLDLSNSIPETGADLEKLNLGTLQVVAVNPADNKATLLGDIGYEHYDRAAYEAGAGLVSIDIDPRTVQQAEQGNWVLRTEVGDTLLAESARRLIPQTPNLYLDQNNDGAVTFQMYQHGKALKQVCDGTLSRLTAGGQNIVWTENVETDALGVLRVPASGKAEGIYAFVAQPGKNASPPSNGINPQLYNYAYVRVLPADDTVAKLAPSWDNVYRHVLLNWNALAPCMDNWLDLANPDQVKRYAPVLRRLTDPAAFEHYRFMPVTRDMTVGQRRLLHRFLDGEGAASAPPGEAVDAMAVAQVRVREEEALTQFAQLSRSLRDPQIE